MINKFILGLKAIFCKDREYKPMYYSDYNRYHQRHVPTYYSHYYSISKYVDSDGYIIKYDRQGLLKDIQDCNAMLLWMGSKKINAL